MRGGEIRPPPPVSPKSIRRSGKVDRGKRKKRSDNEQKKRRQPDDGEHDDENEGESEPGEKGKVINIIA